MRSPPTVAGWVALGAALGGGCAAGPADTGAGPDTGGAGVEAAACTGARLRLRRSDRWDDGVWDAIEEERLGSDGRLERRRNDDDADGRWDRVMLRRTDAAGREMLTLTDADGVPGYERRAGTERGADGRVLRTWLEDGSGAEPPRERVFGYAGPWLVAEEEDQGRDGRVDRRWVHRVDALGRRVGTDEDLDADGTVDRWTWLLLRADGQPAHTWTRARGGTALHTAFAYDDAGRRVADETDVDGDGVPDSRTTYTWTAEGRPASLVVDDALDGIEDVRFEWDWDAAGLNVAAREERDGRPGWDRVTRRAALPFGGRITWVDDWDDGFVDLRMVETVRCAPP